MLVLHGCVRFLLRAAQAERYTMRLCDFMVDHLGEWDLIVCNGNSVDTIFRYGKAWSSNAPEVGHQTHERRFSTTVSPDAMQDSTMSVTGREQQLIFRHRPGRLEHTCRIRRLVLGRSSSQNSGGRNVFMAQDVNVAKLGRAPLLPPNYWKESSRPKGCQKPALTLLLLVKTWQDRIGRPGNRPRHG